MIRTLKDQVIEDLLTFIKRSPPRSTVSLNSAHTRTEGIAEDPWRNSKGLLEVHLVEEFTEEGARTKVSRMIETETVMPRVRRSQTRTFSTAATSAFERKDGPTMEAIYRENKAGAEGPGRGKNSATRPEVAYLYASSKPQTDN